MNCPFGAIADKSQIFQVITAINQGHEVIATVAPSFVGQFGKGGVGRLRAAFKQLGFAGIEEVATAVVNAIHDRHPDLEVNVMAAEGLDNCRAMMKDAVKGKYPGYLLEGMACPGGCVAGAGTLSAINRASAAVKRYAKTVAMDVATENEYNPLISELAGSVSPEIEITEVREVQNPKGR